MLPLFRANNTSESPLNRDSILIGRITSNRDLPEPLRSEQILLIDDSVSHIPAGFALILLKSDVKVEANFLEDNIIRLQPELDYLSAEDVIKFNPHDRSIRTMYRRDANAHSFMLTERCNSFCLMCSQPPKNVDDGYIVNEVLQAIPLLARESHEVILSGGEPTLLGDRLLEIIRACRQHLPNTAVHILTNGRNFRDAEWARKIASVRHPDIMMGIPLYSDIAQIHDFVVQAKGAFDETIRGILNLKRYGQKVEIRVVIHQQTFNRLPQLATYIARNLLFVDHVALMGLEITGFTRANLDSLWIDPYDYRDELAEAVDILSRSRIRTSVYNHQLCVLSESVRPFALKSISDWKNEYVDECGGCEIQPRCGGFFTSGVRHRYSDHIQPVTSY